MVLRLVLGPDETPYRAARWVALAHPRARRKLFTTYCALFQEADPAFDVARFTELVRRAIQRRRDRGELLTE